eukprot:1666457-Prymnesium_polylepis.1
MPVARELSACACSCSCRREREGEGRCMMSEGSWVPWPPRRQRLDRSAGCAMLSEYTVWVPLLHAEGCACACCMIAPQFWPAQTALAGAGCAAREAAVALLAIQRNQLITHNLLGIGTHKNVHTTAGSRQQPTNHDALANHPPLPTSATRLVE